MCQGLITFTDFHLPALTQAPDLPQWPVDRGKTIASEGRAGPRVHRRQAAACRGRGDPLGHPWESPECFKHTDTQVPLPEILILILGCSLGMESFLIV